MKKLIQFSMAGIVCLLISSCSESEDPANNPVEVVPTITGFSPTSGTQGTVVTLTGTNFSPASASNVVKFNGTAATVTAATATSITVSVPAGATTGKISVQVDNQSASSANDFTINSSASTVTIVSFSPASAARGTSVVLLGTNFSAVTTGNLVKFNGTVASVLAASQTSLTAVVPDGASTGRITVQVGTEIATSSTDFVFIQTAINGVETLAGNGALGFVDGAAADARFYQPTGLAFDATGNLYVADAENHRIRKITTDGTVSTFAGSASPGYVDGTGGAAKFYSPRAVAVDAAGNVYVADGGNHCIRKITSAGVVSTLAGSGAYGFAEGTGTGAQFYFPKGIAVDAAGNVYVADDLNQRIRKITPTGTVSTLAGSTSGNADGVGSTAQFSSPRGVAVDVNGNVYVADAGNSRIRKITPAGTVTTIAGSTGGFTDATGASARFDEPAGLVVDSSGNIYVADDENERIRKITPDGAVTTLAGGFVPGFTDGEGEDAQFRSPTGIALDASGDLFVADRHNHAIRIVH